MKRALIPTPLFSNLERPPIHIVDPSPPKWTDALAVPIFAARCLIHVAVYLIERKIGWVKDARDLSRWMRLEMERLGILFIKAGQLAAMRKDLFPASFCNELSRLHDSASGFPWKYVEEVLRKELGREPEEVFSEITLEPVAAASVGQVHRARLKGAEREVAVKVQRPHVVANCARDLRQIRFLVRVAEFLGIWSHARWRQMYEQLRLTMVRETDYRYEAASLRSMIKTLRGHEVICPKVYRSLSTRKVLVMEFISGVPMSDFIRASRECPARLRLWLLENSIDPKAVGRKLYETHTRQVFEDNLFHGDLHPGNILLLRDSRMALIDFGAVGSIQASMLRRYYQIFEANAERDYLKVAQLFLLLSPVPPTLTRSQLEMVQTGIVQALESWQAQSEIKDVPYHCKSLTSAMQGIATVFRKYRIPFTWELLTVNRAEVTMDASLEYLLPSANYFELIEAYREQAWRRTIGKMFEGDSVRRTANALLSAVSSWVERNESGFGDEDLALRRAVLEFVLPPRSLTPAGIFVRFAAQALFVVSLAALASTAGIPGMKGIAQWWAHLLQRLLPCPLCSEALIRFGVPLAAIYCARMLGKLAPRLGETGAAGAR